MIVWSLASKLVNHVKFYSRYLIQGLQLVSVIFIFVIFTLDFTQLSLISTLSWLVSFAIIYNFRFANRFWTSLVLSVLITLPYMDYLFFKFNLFNFLAFSFVSGLVFNFLILIGFILLYINWNYIFKRRSRNHNDESQGEREKSVPLLFDALYEDYIFSKFFNYLLIVLLVFLVTFLFDFVMGDVIRDLFLFAFGLTYIGLLSLLSRYRVYSDAYFVVLFVYFLIPVLLQFIGPFFGFSVSIPSSPLLHYFLLVSLNLGFIYLVRYFKSAFFDVLFGFVFFYYSFVFLWSLTGFYVFLFVGVYFYFLFFIVLFDFFKFRSLFDYNNLSSFYSFSNVFSFVAVVFGIYFLYYLTIVVSSLFYLVLVSFLVIVFSLIGLVSSKNALVVSLTRFFGLASSVNTVFDRRDPSSRSIRVFILSVLIVFVFAYLVVSYLAGSSILPFSGIFSVFLLVRDISFIVLFLYIGFLAVLYVFMAFFYVFPYEVSRSFIVSRRPLLIDRKYLIIRFISFQSFYGLSGDSLIDRFEKFLDSGDKGYTSYDVRPWGIPRGHVSYSVISVFVWFLYTSLFLFDKNNLVVFGFNSLDILMFSLVTYIILSVISVPYLLYRCEDLKELIFSSTFLSIIVGLSYAFLAIFWWLFYTHDVNLIRLTAIGVAAGLSAIFLLVDIPARGRLSGLKKEELDPLFAALNKLREMLSYGLAKEDHIANLEALISAIESKYNVNVTPAERILASILAGSLLTLFGFLHVLI